MLLITGASGGIGQGNRLAFGKEGYSLYLHYHQNTPSIRELLHLFPPIMGNTFRYKQIYRLETAIKNLLTISFLLIPLFIIVGLVIMGYLLIQIKDNLEKMTMIHLTSPLLLTKELFLK